MSFKLNGKRLNFVSIESYRDPIHQLAASNGEKMIRVLCGSVSFLQQIWVEAWIE